MNAKIISMNIEKESGKGVYEMQGNMDLTAYDAALAEWAAEEGHAADAARLSGDERTLSLALMKKSMYETMLLTLGHRAPQALEVCAGEMEKRAADFRARGDYDSADRCNIQRGAILRARALLYGEEDAQ